MKKLTKYVLPCVAALVASGSAEAQNLVKEVVIEREIVPVERPATRPSWVAPGVYTPRVETPRLQAGEYNGAAELTRRASRLEPVAWNDTIEVSPYRGYAALGYFPAFNLGASAGYRFVRNDRTDAGAWLQYDGASWSGFDKDGDKTSLNTFTLGADVTHNAGNGRLKAALGYTFSRAGYQPAPAIPDEGLQTMNNLGLSVEWAGTGLNSKLEYAVGARFGYTAFGKDRVVMAIPYNPVTSNLVQPSPMTLDGLKETTFGIDGKIAYNVGKLAGWSLDINADFVHPSNGTGLVPWMIPSAAGTSHGYTGVTAVADGGTATWGDIALTPAYSFVKGAFSARLGVRVDLNTGRDKGVDIAPAVNLAWGASDFFGIGLDVTGGGQLNSASELYSRLPWMAGVLNHGRSHIPVDARLNLNIGKINGFSAVIFGGVSKADNVAVPVRMDGLYTWANHSMTGFNYGLSLGYEYRDLVSFNASAEGARHGKYFRWLDNARWVIDLNLAVHPIKQLTVEAGWNLRLDRRFWDLSPELSSYSLVEGTLPIPYWGGDPAKAGDANNLRLGAKWAFTDAFTVFARAENLLNRHWSLMPGLRSNGIHGAIGLAVKF